MVIGSAYGARQGEAWDALQALVADDGSASVAYTAYLIVNSIQMRDLADAAHCLCMLHGRHPGVVELAMERSADPVVNAWLSGVGRAFALERSAIIKLVATAGPLPSTPGQAESETAIAAQRHALDMLAGSDRLGCPVGAVMALVLDWPAIRAVLDGVAARLHIELPVLELPTEEDSAAVLASLGGNAAFERALLFGAQQTLAQHRALWHLLEARAEARGTN